MNALIDNLDDSALFCKSIIQKRKLADNDNPKNSKQLKLDFPYSSKKVIQSKDKPVESNNKNITLSSQDSKWNESSSYFTKKSTNICPLCLKSFKTDSSYSAHMKQCAKAHKMSTNQLLSALELQKERLLERQDVGLNSQKATSPVKATIKKRNTNDAGLYDLALGLALSKSLTGAESKGVTSPEVQKSTLEEFGFKASNATAGLCRKMFKKSVLKERTTEERQRILIEKVAVILLDENQESNMKLNSSMRQNQVPQLWSMGENNEKSGWYVNKIKSLLSPSEENLDNIETFALQKENPEERTASTLPENISKEIYKLNLPRPEIYKDCSKMINNSTLSDFKAKTKDCRDIYLHSFVLFVRCQEILQKDYKAIIEEFNFSTVICFLEFLYCGTLNALVRSEINNLIDLANEFNYKELIEVLDCLKNNLSGKSVDETLNSSKNEIEKFEISVIENLEDKDLFAEDDEKNNTNVEKSYWSFIQHEKKGSELEEMREVEKKKGKTPSGVAEEVETKTKSEEKIVLKNQSELQKMSDDSATKDLDDVLQKISTNTNSDCIILSSGSDSKTPENLAECKTPSPVNVNYQVPYLDCFDNFHYFSEELFSPVAIHSQSLITGDISQDSAKSKTLVQKDSEEKNDLILEGSKKLFGYCSTPVRVRKSSKINPATGPLNRSKRKKKRCELSASRILRKSLNLQQKSLLSKKRSKNKKKQCQELAEALTNSIFTKLSKSSSFKVSPVSRRFVEVTPISDREEFVDNVTPSPNYSNMGESLLKEQLTMYGLKKNLAKSKAKKILRHIYEELHPLYNIETGKIVKKLSGNTPKTEKTKSKACSKTTKLKPSKSSNLEKTIEEKLNISVESVLSNGSIISMNSLTDDSSGSEFENLNDTLTQSVPNSPIDLPSAFCEFLHSNPDFYEKILLYEPVWLEELQRNLKEIFKKHFKKADLMDYLDQKCITFRSETQTKNIQRRNEKKKENAKKKKSSAS